MKQRLNRLKSLNQVVTIITRGAADQGELLVVKHPNNGLCLPCQSVDHGKSLAAAAIDLVVEHLGPTGTVLVGEICQFESTLADNRGVVLIMTKLFDSPESDASSKGYGFKRGDQVFVRGREGKFSEVERDPFDSCQEFTDQQEAVKGYVRTSILGQQITQHVFHFHEQGSIEEISQVDKEAWHPSRWLAFEPKPILNSNHQPLLDAAYGRVRAYLREDNHDLT